MACIQSDNVSVSDLIQQRGLSWDEKKRSVVFCPGCQSGIPYKPDVHLPNGKRHAKISGRRPLG